MVRQSVNLVRKTAVIVRDTIIANHQYGNWVAKAKKQAAASKIKLACNLLKSKGKVTIFCQVRF